MRFYQVFAAMSPEQASTVLRAVDEHMPGVFAQAVAAAGFALKTRPAYLQRQPVEKRVEAVRRALSRVAGNAMAGELLAVYFLECRKPLLVEWLDGVGLEHEEGVLTPDAPPQPEPARLRKAVETFLGADAESDRRLLLAAFAAQDAIDWPLLDELLRIPS